MAITQITKRVVDDSIIKTITLTQAEYDGLGSYSSSTIYITPSKNYLGAAELLTSVGPYSTFNSNQFTGTGSQTDFTLTQAVEEDKSFVFIQGIYQEKSTYSISGTTLTFTTAPQSGYTVEVITVGEVSMLPDTIDIDNFSGTGSQVDYVLTSTPSTENAIDVYINGLYQQKDTFSLSGNTLTFSTAPPNGSTIEVKHQFVASVKGEVVLTAGTGINITENSSNNFTISNTLIDVTVSFNAPTGQSLTYTALSPISSIGQAGSIFPTTTFTVTDPGGGTLSGTAVITGLPAGLTSSQSYNNTNPGNVLTITLSGVYPSANSVGTNLVISNLTVTAPPLTVSYLVVAGGGGSNTGGGGAGGYLTNYGGTALTLASSTNYLVTVGAGGAGATHVNKTSVTSGSDSIFSIIGSTGGGRSGLTDGGLQDGVAGGSGGGGAGDGNGSTGGSGNTPSTTPSQGNNGGGAPNSAPYPGGGGGGAGGIGGAGSGQYGGAGGLGLANSITGTSTFYAGGGGGGAAYSNSQGYPGQTGGIGGSGIGGNGGSNANGGDGTANTGSGGGGLGGYTIANRTGGNGGSGVVILRYPSIYTISGLSGTTTTVGTDKVTIFTAGTGNISFS